MRSVFFEAPGGPEVLRLREESRPRAAEGELLARVLASGVNGADLNLRSGRSRAADTSGRPGLEVCGIVERLGHGVDDPARSPSGTRWSVGDTVCALVAGGGYAEYVSAPVEQCLPPPPGMDALHAAGIIETAATIWDNVFIRGGLAAGNVILDVAGAGYLARNLAALNMDGRLVVIAVNAGAEGTLDLRQVMQRRAVLTGSILKSRTPAQKRALLEAVWREVWPLYAEGRMKAVVGSVLPLERAAEAHAAMEAGGAIGKTILDCRA